MSSHYTKEEDEVILKCIAESPDNLAKAFRKAKVKLNKYERSIEGIKHRWYQQLSKHPQKANSTFMAISKRRYSLDRKNAETVIRESKWKRILKIIFEK